MYNALRIDALERLVQVGIRDQCEDEVRMVQQSEGRIVQHTDRAIQQALMRGQTWHQRCEAIVGQLPQQVYVSFDIDALDPSLCPGTGTPVPGGLGFEQAFYLIQAVVASGRRIIGFDLVEVSSASEWDAIVGARALYRLAILALEGRSPLA